MPERRWLPGPAALPWLVLALPGCVASMPPGAAARLRELDAQLLSHDSATATLEQWCGELHLADPPTVRAQRITGPDRPADATVRRELRVAPDQPLGYRHVRLLCGTTLLSEADNWYVPSRLTPAMKEVLDHTDEPFGRVVQPLGFTRITLSAEMPRGSSTVLRHRAVLVLADGTPISYVTEAYQSTVLGIARLHAH